MAKARVNVKEMETVPSIQATECANCGWYIFDKEKIPSSLAKIKPLHISCFSCGKCKTNLDFCRCDLWEVVGEDFVCLKCGTVPTERVYDRSLHSVLNSSLMRILILDPLKNEDSYWSFVCLDIKLKIWNLLQLLYAHEEKKLFSLPMNGFRRYGLIYSSVTKWPVPSDININQYPFIVGDITSISSLYQQYWPMISSCNQLESGSVAYLTIQESLVLAGECHRRPGLHTERGRYLTLQDSSSSSASKGQYTVKIKPLGGWRIKPQGRITNEVIEGGIYVASNISESYAVWDVQLANHSLIGEGGDISHLRLALGKPTYTLPEQIWWITDTTPHEALIMKRTQYRQFFRIISSVEYWYRDRSTANQFVQPKATIV